MRRACIGLALVAAACGGSSNETADATADSAAALDARADSSADETYVPRDVGRDDVTPDDASAAASCSALADALCTRISACAPFLVTRTWIDDADCRARAALACEERMSLPDSYPPLDVAADCKKSLAAISCDALFARGVHGLDAFIDYPCPVVGGLRDLGEKCVADAQCATGYCAYRWQGCGFCRPAPVDGGAPPDGYECGPWLVLGADKDCHAPGSSLADCDVNHPCAWNLTCTAGKCAPGGALGDACDDAHRCDWTHGVKCDAASSKCVAATLSNEGDACDESTPFVLLAGSFCTGGTACEPSGASKACVKRILDGKSCTPSDRCTAPASCITSLCTTPSDATCN